MDALVDNGKPVLPIPFLGWDAFAIYRDILENWNESPVCGLTERQYLELMKPWRRNPVTLFRLLKAALATEPEIFISYRRDDNPVAAGRLFDELAHSYGQNLVFIDYAGLLGGQALEDILTKVEQSRVLLLVVGDNWITERLEDPTDYVRREIIAAQKNGLRVIPVLAGHTARPAVQQIPEPLQFILNLKFLPLQMDDWEVGVNRLKQTIDDVVL
jgi:hypothetical protein